VCGPDSVAIFDALHRHGTVSEAMLYAFDLVERRIGIVLSDHTTEDGALLFVHACRMGLEGIVS
jgi:hypothetical protein